MYPFVESICIKDGAIGLLDYHQARLDRTFERFYMGCQPHDLVRIFSQKEILGGWIKARVLYNDESYKIEMADYQMRNLRSLQLTESNSVDYSYKTTDRNMLDVLYSKRGEADDILIVKEGKVTDAYTANVAFFDGSQWYTPKTYLLNGVKRQYLLDTGKLKEIDISPVDIVRYKKVSLINAMLDLGQMELSTKSIC